MYKNKETIMTKTWNLFFLFSLIFLSLLFVNFDCFKNEFRILYSVTNINGRISPKYNPDQLSFELLINENISKFGLVDKIVTPENEMNYKMTSIIFGGHYTYYSNGAETFYTLNYNGEELQIESSKSKIGFKILKDSLKKINNIECCKATTSYLKLNLDTKKRDTIKGYFWFAPSIPVKNGPLGLNNLPGLVLECSLDSKIVFFAKSIENKNVKIEFPKRNKLISEKEFEEMVYESVMERKELEKANKKYIDEEVKKRQQKN